MKKYVGVVHHSDLEGGQWLLRLDNGDIYQLVGRTDFQSGARITVSGEIERDVMGFAMTAPRLRVK